MGSGCSGCSAHSAMEDLQLNDGGLKGGSRATLELVADPAVSQRPWRICESVPLVTTGFDMEIDDDGGGGGGDVERPQHAATGGGGRRRRRRRRSTPVVASEVGRFTHVFVILDGRWRAGEVTRVSEGRTSDKLEVRLYGDKRNAPPVVVNLTSAQYRLRRAPAGGFFAEGARLEVLDQFVSKKTKRYKEQWRPAHVVSTTGTGGGRSRSSRHPDDNDDGGGGGGGDGRRPSRHVRRVQVSFDGWGEQHNIWLDVLKDASRLRPHIEHAPRDWALSYFRGGRVGLDNLGNTCYLNAAVQCLAHIRPLALYFLSGDYKRDLVSARPTGGGGSESSAKPCLAPAFAQVVTMLWYGTDAHSVSPATLKTAMGRINAQFAGFRQHDAQELLCFLLDALHEELNRVHTPVPYEELDRQSGESVAAFADRCWRYDRARSDSYVKDLFCGQLHSAITCQECGAVSTCFDPFWNLSVPIPKPPRGRGGHRHVTVEACVSRFSSTEELKDDDMYFCGKCKAHRVGTKTIRVWRAPRVLVLHLRRFARRGGRFLKANEEVDFPLHGFNIAPYWRGGLADGAAATVHAQDGTAPAGAGTRDTNRSSTTNNRGMVYNLNSFASHVGVANDGHYLATCQCPAAGAYEWGAHNQADTVGGDGAGGRVGRDGGDDGGHGGDGGDSAAAVPAPRHQWVLFNDDLVEPVDKINKRKAYLLFYIRAHGEEEYCNDVSANTSDGPGGAGAQPAAAPAAGNTALSARSSRHLTAPHDQQQPHHHHTSPPDARTLSRTSTPNTAARFAVADATLSPRGRSILV